MDWWSFTEIALIWILSWRWRIILVPTVHVLVSQLVGWGTRSLEFVLLLLLYLTEFCIGCCVCGMLSRWHVWFIDSGVEGNYLMPPIASVLLQPWVGLDYRGQFPNKASCERSSRLFWMLGVGQSEEQISYVHCNIVQVDMMRLCQNSCFLTQRAQFKS